MKKLYVCVVFPSLKSFPSSSLAHSVLIIKTNQRVERIKEIKYLKLCEEFILRGPDELP